MNIERGIKRLLIVVSGLLIALGALLGVMLEAVAVVGVALVAIGVIWAAFFALRWVARGFMREPENMVKRQPIGWKAVKDWSVIGIVVSALAYLIGALLWALWEGLREPAVTWNALLATPAAMWNGFLATRAVIWLRHTAGDRGAALIGFGLAALVAFGLVSEWRDERLRRRQSRAYQRLTEHYAACQACQQQSDDEDGRDGYCPVGQQLHTDWERS